MKERVFPERIYTYFHCLSLDVVTGACAGMYFFDHILNTQLGLSFYVLLGSAVWFIYTLEHLMDARNIQYMASTDRHAFHQRNFKLLSGVLVLVAIIGLWLAIVCFTRDNLLFIALVFGSLFLVHIILVKRLRGKWILFKEFSTASLYVLGILFAPFVYYTDLPFPYYFWLLAIGYVLVAWFNTLFFSLMDKNSDEKDGLASTVLVLGEVRLKNLLFVLMIILLVYFIFLYVLLQSYVYLPLSILFLIVLFHAIAFLQMDKNRKVIRQKLDASFILPFLLLVV